MIQKDFLSGLSGGSAIEAAPTDWSFPSAESRAVSLARLDEALEGEEEEEEGDIDGDLAEVGGVGVKKSFGMAPEAAPVAETAPVTGMAPVVDDGPELLVVDMAPALASVVLGSWCWF